MLTSRYQPLGEFPEEISPDILPVWVRSADAQPVLDHELMLSACKRTTKAEPAEALHEIPAFDRSKAWH